MGSACQKIAFVYGTLPTVEEVEQIALLSPQYEVVLFSSESIVTFLISNFYNSFVKCLPVPDYNDETGYLPGLEKALEGFDVVVLKERLGLYSYQVVKSKWVAKFRLLVWMDNARAYPCDDIPRLQTIRHEVMNHADGFMVQSKLVWNALLLEGVAAEKIRLFRPWVEARVIKSDRLVKEQLGIPEHSYVVLYANPVEWEEGLLEFLMGLKWLQLKEAAFAKKIHLVVASMGSYAAEFRQKTMSLGLDAQVHYVMPVKESFEKILAITQVVFCAPQISRDRIEADPYHYLRAMVHGLPVISPRTSVGEELLEKHRFDFCFGSARSLAKALKKSLSEKALISDIKEKNLEKTRNIFSKEAAKHSLITSVSDLVQLSQWSQAELKEDRFDDVIGEVDKKIATKQYLIAVDMIEKIMSAPTLPVFHRANLFRLMGDAFLKLGRGDLAQSAYVKSLELDAHLAKSYIGLGTYGLTKGQYDLSMVHFQKAVTLAPTDEMATLGLGLAFQGLDLMKEAVRWVKRALEINPHNLSALYTMVKIAQETGDLHESESCLRRYLSLHPNDLNMMYALAGLLYQQGMYDEVLDWLAKLLAIDPLDSRTQQLLKMTKKSLARSRPEVQSA